MPFDPSLCIASRDDSMGRDPIGRMARYNILKPELLALKQRASSSVGTVYSSFARLESL
jgi:hypothetical protein